ncbi:MAG TPA: hypothetical protein VKS80_01725 [Trinickia sp.]|nr:hypothetical protein [Trinickia sp.]
MFIYIAKSHQQSTAIRHASVSMTPRATHASNQQSAAGSCAVAVAVAQRQPSQKVGRGTGA